jgi:hypothetical protein
VRSVERGRQLAALLRQRPVSPPPASRKERTLSSTTVTNPANPVTSPAMLPPAVRPTAASSPPPPRRTRRSIRLWDTQTGALVQTFFQHTEVLPRPSRPPCASSRTNWTHLVPPSVLSGHVSSLPPHVLPAHPPTAPTRARRGGHRWSPRSRGCPAPRASSPAASTSESAFGPSTRRSRRRCCRESG